MGVRDTGDVQHLINYARTLRGQLQIPSPPESVKNTDLGPYLYDRHSGPIQGKINQLKHETLGKLAAAGAGKVSYLPNSDRRRTPMTAIRRPFLWPDEAGIWTLRYLALAAVLATLVDEVLDERGLLKN